MADPGARITIGSHVFFNNYCSLNASREITIGGYTIFGEGVKVYDHNHCYRDHTKPIKEQGYSVAPVHIGAHCWIASNVVILKGVSIGDRSVIGAGCVIYKDVPAGSVVICRQDLQVRQQ